VGGGGPARPRGGTPLTRPEEALEHARAEAARKRAEGGYPEPGPGALAGSIAPDKPSVELLREWAAIQVDPDLVYSTRRLGAPITVFKRLLMRLLRQYHVELESRQTRFNIALLAHLEDLEARVARLERSPDE
jgi:hypothetical protein